MKKTCLSRLTVRLSLAAVAMFGFGYALVPIYDLICDITGLNGKVELVSSEYDPSRQVIDMSREIQVRFVSVQNTQTQVKLLPGQNAMKVHPGKVYQVDYVIENPFDRPVAIQAIPSVSPSQVADNLKKIQCFCFSNLHLQPKETHRTSVVFYLDDDIESSASSVILSYTLFDITDQVTEGNT